MTSLRRANDSPREKKRWMRGWDSGRACREFGDRDRNRNRARWWRCGGTGVAYARGSRAERAERVTGWAKGFVMRLQALVANGRGRCGGGEWIWREEEGLAFIMSGRGCSAPSGVESV